MPSKKEGFCPSCEETVGFSDVMDHFEELHPEFTKAPLSYFIGCGVCDTKVGDKDLRLMFDHCYRHDHSSEGIFIDWKQNTEIEAKRIQNLISSGIKLMKGTYEGSDLPPNKIPKKSLPGEPASPSLQQDKQKEKRPIAEKDKKKALQNPEAELEASLTSSKHGKENMRKRSWDETMPELRRAPREDIVGNTDTEFELDMNIKGEPLAEPALCDSFSEPSDISTPKRTRLEKSSESLSSEVQAGFDSESAKFPLTDVPLRSIIREEDLAELGDRDKLQRQIDRKNLESLAEAHENPPRRDPHQALRLIAPKIAVVRLNELDRSLLGGGFQRLDTASLKEKDPAECIPLLSAAINGLSEKLDFAYNILVQDTATILKAKRGTGSTHLTTCTGAHPSSWSPLDATKTGTDLKIRPSAYDVASPPEMEGRTKANQIRKLEEKSLDPSECIWVRLRQESREAIVNLSNPPPNKAKDEMKHVRDLFDRLFPGRYQLFLSAAKKGNPSYTVIPSSVVNIITKAVNQRYDSPLTDGALREAIIARLSITVHGRRRGGRVMREQLDRPRHPEQISIMQIPAPSSAEEAMALEQEVEDFNREEWRNYMSGMYKCEGADPFAEERRSQFGALMN